MEPSRWSRKRIAWAVVAFVCLATAVGVAVWLLSSHSDDHVHTASPMPTPETTAATVNPTLEPDTVVVPVVDATRGISDVRLVSPSTTGRFTIEWESTNGEGATLRVFSANAGTIYEAPTSVGAHVVTPDLRTTLLQGDTVDFSVDGQTVARTPVVTPSQGNDLKRTLDMGTLSSSSYLRYNRFQCAVDYQGDTIVASVGDTEFPAWTAKVYKLLEGAWVDATLLVGATRASVGVSGDGKSTFVAVVDTVMSVGLAVHDWDDENHTWDEASPAYSSPGGLYSTDASWDGLTVASVESYNARFENNNLVGADADGVYVRRRTSRGAAWTTAKLAITGSTLTWYENHTQISHDGRLVLVSDPSNNRMLCVSDNAGTYVYRGDLNVTTSGCGVLGKATKCIMSAHVDGNGTLVASRYVIDDFDTNDMPTWTLEKSATVPDIAAQYGYTGTPSLSERFNEDMTVMVLTDSYYNATGAGVNGTQDNTSVANSGHVWIFRRGVNDTEWVLEANVNADVPSDGLLFGGRGAALAASPACPVVAVPQRALNGSNAAVVLL